MTHLGILLRICVHLGDIIVEDKDICGDSVNLAARIVTCRDVVVQLPVAHIAKCRHEGSQVALHRSLVNGMMLRQSRT